ncbi:unnamed protein product [Effrenium voratum]|nr:unnamed protein product [Effrenium voratum]
MHLLAEAQHPDPKHVLGVQVMDQYVVLRCWVAGAEEVAVINQQDIFLPESPDAREDPPAQVPLFPVEHCPEECPWLFERAFSYEGKEDKSQLQRWSYEICVQYSGGATSVLTYPHSLGSLLPENFLTGWAHGMTETPPAAMFGAHHMELHTYKTGLWGTRFAVWAPRAHSVSVVGDFNYWDCRAHPMCSRGKYGVWEIFLPRWDLRGQKYAYHIMTETLKKVIKVDPYALEFVEPSAGHDAVVPECDDYGRTAWKGSFPWTDEDWLATRLAKFGGDWSAQPLSIYEVHLGSWMHAKNYRDIAEPLVAHVTEMGFTAVEFLPVSQYPCDKSWGYQCAAGLYAVDRRLGSADDFRFLVDTLHNHGIAVFMDFVGAHFANDEWGLAEYSGVPQYEYEGSLGQIPGWGTARFNYAKPEVQAYLLGAAHHWIDQFHVDGLRIDAVAAIIYGNFGREEDGDEIMAGKGKLNEHGVALLKRLCVEVRSRHPGVLLSAEESTNFRWVTDRQVENGTERQREDIRDLGFHLKWNMGFAHDTLSMFSSKFRERPQLETFGWRKLAWFLCYAFNERWILPFSHDNVQKKSLVDQMAADKVLGTEGKYAQLRVLFMYTIGMLGRPLLFMGSEIGESWSYDEPIDWEGASEDPQKQQLKRWIAKLLKLYRELPCLHRQDDRADGFHWLDKDEGSKCVYCWKRMAKNEHEAIIIVNASNEHITQYHVNCGESVGAWECIAATSMEAECFTPRTERVTLGRGRFTTELPPVSAQLWVPRGGRLDPVLIHFDVTHEDTQHGDSLRIVGNCPELGNWVPEEGAKLRTNSSNFPVWRGSVKVPRDLSTLEFKFVTVSPDHDPDWEPIYFNRSLVFSGAKEEHVDVEWGEA